MDQSITIIPVESVAAQPELVSLNDAARTLEEKAVALAVTNVETLEQGVALLGDLKALDNSKEKSRLTFKAPITAYGKAIDDLFRTAGDSLKWSIAEVKTKVDTFRRIEQERAAALAEQLRRDAEEQARKDAIAAAVAQGATLTPEAIAEVKVDPRDLPLAIPASEAAGVRPATRKTWTYDVVEPSDIPFEYTIIDDVAVKAAIARGVRSIPGLRIYERETVIARSTR